MKIVTAAEMREIDRLTTEQYGVPSLTLMENAGTAVADFAQEHFDFNSVCVICGKGNNGGDGFVAARKLKEAEKEVSVVILAKNALELRGDAAQMFQKLGVEALWVGEDTATAQPAVQRALESDLIVDAIVGTGFKPPLQGLARQFVEVMNRCGKPILAVDIPSGAYTDSMLPPEAQGLMANTDGVVTFTAPKPLHVFGPVTNGAIGLAPIGTEWQLVNQVGQSLKLHTITGAEAAEVFPAREPDAHKGDFGHVLVIAGSVGKAGAAAMAGMAALRTGAGLVTVASPRSVQPIVAGYAPEFMTESLPETAEGTLSISAIDSLQQLLAGKRVVALGPGLSRNPETSELVRQLLPLIEVPVVLDADGLNAFEGHSDQLRHEAGLILTPHPGEMTRITGVKTPSDAQGRLQTARSVAEIHSAVVVLKGHRTLTASPTGKVWVNTSGNPGMAKGGSGDILAGMIAATVHQMNEGGFSVDSQSDEVKELLKRRQQGDRQAEKALEERFHAAILDWVAMQVATAAYLHGVAGDLARDLRGEYSLVATDIVDNIGAAIRICRHESGGKLLSLQR